jgi:hypothetical protein
LKNSFIINKYSALDGFIRKPVTSIIMFYLHNVLVKKTGQFLTKFQSL